MILLAFAGLILPATVHAPSTSPTSTASTAPVNLLLDYGNGTLVWYNNTIVPSDWNFYNVTNLVTNGNIGSIFFASFGSHFVYSINNAGCQFPDIFCSQAAWSLWTLDGICWDAAQTGADQVLVSQTTTVAWFLVPPSVFGEFPPTGENCLGVTINVKPGSSQPILNIGAQGTIPVAILSTGSFDATQVNPSTVTFGKTGEEAPALGSSPEDVNGDGTLDIVLHFSIPSTGLQVGDTQVILMGRTLDWTPFRGFGTIQTLSPRSGFRAVIT